MFNIYLFISYIYFFKLVMFNFWGLGIGVLIKNINYYSHNNYINSIVTFGLNEHVLI